MEELTVVTEDQAPSKMEAFKELLKSFKSCCSNTSMKGLPRVFKTRYKCMKITWIIAIHLFLMIAFYQSANLVISFLKFATVTYINDVKIGYDKQPDWSRLSLGGVTFCNSNPVPSEQHLVNVLTYEKYLQDLEANLGLNGVGNVGFTLDNVKSPNGYYRNIPYKNLTDIGYSYEDFIVYCQYTLKDGLADVSKSCSEIAYITVLSTPEFFNCFTIAINNSLVPPHAVPTSLSGILYLDNVNQVINKPPPMSQEGLTSAGALAIFHSPDDYPDIDNQAVSLPVGFESMVHVSQVERIRKGEPYSNCMDYDDIKYFNLQQRQFNYSMNMCMKNCLFENILKKCNCVEPAAAMLGAETNIEGIGMCGALGSSSQTIINSANCSWYVSSTDGGVCRHKCPYKCHQVSVSTSSYLLKWPRASYQLDLYKNFIHNKSYGVYFREYYDIIEKLEAGTINSSQAIREVRHLRILEDNFVKFTISANQETVSVVEDAPKLSPTELLSQIGGILNLYSGITTVLLIELIEVVVNWIGSLINMYQRTTTVVPLKGKD